MEACRDFFGGTPKIGRTDRSSSHAGQLHLALVATTLPDELEEPPTSRRSVHLRTAWSASFMGVSSIAASTGRMSLGQARSKRWLDVFETWDV